MFIEFGVPFNDGEGLSLYERRTCIVYKTRIAVGHNYKGEDVLLVLLVNGRNEKTVVGLFDDKIEADNFVNKYFRNKKYIHPVYANNHLTKEYIQRENENLDKVFRIRF